MKPNITFKSVLDKYTDIDLRNEHFNKLSDEGKRLEIAWDSLKLVVSGKVAGSWRRYWDASLLADIRMLNTPKELHSFVNHSLPTCEVCARGAVMLSTIRLGNRISPYDNRLDKGCVSNLQGFSMKTMYQMENRYEWFTEDYPYASNTDENLMNILCNVLVNGDFNENDKTDYLIP